MKGRSHTVEKRKASHPQKPHATSQPSRFSHTPRLFCNYLRVGLSHVRHTSPVNICFAEDLLLHIEFYPYKWSDDTHLHPRQLSAQASANVPSPCYEIGMPSKQRHCITNSCFQQTRRDWACVSTWCPPACPSMPVASTARWVSQCQCWCRDVAWTKGMAF